MHYFERLGTFNETIKITVEMENKEQLPILDIPVIRNCTNNLNFDVFSKVANKYSIKYIPNNSHHARQYKMVSLKFEVLSVDKSSGGRSNILPKIVTW